MIVIVKSASIKLLFNLQSLFIVTSAQFCVIFPITRSHVHLRGRGDENKDRLEES